jgi:hypothetical protein
MSNIDIHPTRAEYLAFVANWKAEYRKVSAAQRELKRGIRNAQIDRDGRSVATLSWQLQTGKVTATTMLEKRAAMKIAARDAYLATKRMKESKEAV